MEWTIPNELLAQAIGREVLKYTASAELVKKAECDAACILEQIRQILDDDSLDDPECFQKIEAIVTTFHSHGLDTARHDFG